MHFLNVVTHAEQRRERADLVVPDVAKHGFHRTSAFDLKDL